ncbi:kinase [Sutcliffiella rhizosphaerae]|uniref:Uridine kinase n=1 Tax=Sutcliffiella rhizosphaerae TaxID=2880967 RepID=A0ABM8YP22_9BACI|nr:kinase [Sutcliffiella rhizosphaerae]CAG9621501.1 Uridine kinase [Sutcliffiella rhizosphaerae]
MSLHIVTQAILKGYFHRSKKNRPYIVAIDGLSGAGKTTFSKILTSELNQHCLTILLHIDHYIVSRKDRYDTGYAPWYEYYQLQWDVPKLTSDLFIPLHNNCTSLSLPLYDHPSDTISAQSVWVSTDSIILIEGVFLQRKEWRDFYDYRIFKDCPREIRYKRVLDRDRYIGDYEERLEKYKQRYWPGEEHYLAIENPIVNATFVYEEQEGVE